MATASEVPDPNKALFAGGEALTFDDVLVVPGYSEVLPDDVDTTTQMGSIELRVPLLSAAMDTVTCLLSTSPSPRDRQKSRMPSSA